MTVCAVCGVSLPTDAAAIEHLAEELSRERVMASLARARQDAVEDGLVPLGQAMREQRLAVVEAVRAFVADDPMGGDRQRTLDFLDNLRHWEERAETEASS